MRCVLVAMLCLWTACERGGGALVRFDDRLKDQIGDRTARALDRPQASAAFDAFLESIIADPRVTQQGERFATKLMADPALAGAVEAIMARMAESPQVLDAVELLVQQNPDASEEEIGELAGKQFEQRWDTPEVTAAWFAAWDAFLAKLGTSTELNEVTRAVTNAVLASTDAAALDKRINARLVELNGGKRPDSARATSLYIEHAWSEPRIEAFATKFLTNPTVRDATAKLVAELLAIDAVNAALSKQTAMLATNQEVQSRVVRMLQVMYAKDFELEEVRVSLREMMTHPAVVASVRDLLQVLIKNDRARKLAGDWYDTVRNDAALAGELKTFMTGW